MTIDEAHKLIDFATAKNQQGAIKPVDKDRAINVGQRSYISFLLGSLQQYQPGRPFAAVELGNNAIVRQRLTPVIKQTNLSVVGGVANYPTDFIQSDAMNEVTTNKRIRLIEQDRLDSTVNSVIDPVAENPIYILETVGFKFFPSTLASARLSYIANPPDVKWNFTIDEVTGVTTYNPTGSVQPVFNDVSMLEVIVRALAIMGVNLQLGVVQQYAQVIKTQGQ